MRTTPAALLAILALSSACGSPEAPASTSPPASAPSTATATAPATGTAAAPPSSAAAAGASALGEADVRELLTRWEAAQNAGDFDAYGRLYATRFTGVRRSGPRERRFDRARWMDDRRGMFEHPMQVTASEVRVTLAGGTATVDFTQSFTEGTYHDEGPKQLVVVREAGALRIAREEMVQSTLSTVSGAAAMAPGALMPIVSADRERFVVLAPVPDGAQWHEGAPTLVDRGTVVTTRARASSAVPAELAALAGQAIATSNDGGASCPARLGALAVVSRVDVHFGVEQRWDGQRDDGTTGAPASAAEIARDAWGEGLLLVAPLEDADACASPVYARLASLPAAPFFTATDADAATATQVLAQFRASPAWAALDREMHDSGTEGARWDELDGSHPSVRVWERAGGGGRRFAVVLAAGGDGGCADFHGEMWGVFEIGAGGALTRIGDAQSGGYFVPLGAADTDGDGLPEWITPRGVVTRAGPDWALTVDVQYVTHDCDC